MMKKITILIICFYSIISLAAQNDDTYKTNVKDKILTQLYLDDIFTFKDKSGNVIYNYSLLDSIEIDYTFMEYESEMYLDVDFYKFNVKEDKLILNDESFELSIGEMYEECTEFILAINTNKLFNYTYKLKGFSTNDLLFLINDLSKGEKDDMKIKEIINEMDDVFVDLDISCLYNSIRKLKFNSNCIKSGCFRRRPYSISGHGKGSPSNK